MIRATERPATSGSVSPAEPRSPQDAVDRLRGLRAPRLRLPSTDGRLVAIDRPPQGFDRLVMYAYPMTGLPGVPPIPGWDQIPGARGCTSEACSFRDHAAELGRRGAAVVGVSTQSTEYQKEAAARLRLPFPLLSDDRLLLTNSLCLPTFKATLPRAYDGGGRRTVLRRLTLVLHGSRIERTFYPIPSPESHASDVLAWLSAESTGGAGAPASGPGSVPQATGGDPRRRAPLFRRRRV